MRHIHTLKIYNKKYYIGDLTLQDYCLRMKEPREAFFKVMGEFNKDKPLPRMTKYQQEKLIQFLFDVSDEDADKARKITDSDKAKIEEQKTQFLEDIHIWVGFICVALHQSYGEVVQWPKKVFEKMLADLPIITGQKEYDPKRNSKVPDKKKIKEAFGGKNVLAG